MDRTPGRSRILAVGLILAALGSQACARTVPLSLLPAPTLSRPNALGAIRPPLRFRVADLRDATSRRTLLLYHRSESGLVAADPPAGVVTAAIVSELTRSGHVVVRGDRADHVDVVVDGVLHEFLARLRGRALQLDELSATVSATVSMRAHPGGRTILTRTYTGHHEEHRAGGYWFGTDNFSSVKQALDRALIDMIESMVTDETLERALTALAAERSR